jgi:hypothetical protein
MCWRVHGTAFFWHRQPASQASLIKQKPRHEAGGWLAESP